VDDPTPQSTATPPVPIRQPRMRPAAEIAELRDQAEENIHTNGWDPRVDAMSQTLTWVLDDSFPDHVRSFLDTPVSERRAAWIAAGGNPADWPLDDDA
jgi:hypothetical protein